MNSIRPSFRRRSALVATLIATVLGSPTQGQRVDEPRVSLGEPVAVIKQVSGVARQLPEPPRVKLPDTPPVGPDERPLPINLPTALQLAGASPLDIALASQRLSAAQ